MPSLVTPRHSHGCSSYTNDEGKNVFLVAGGYLDSLNSLFSDTAELSVEGGPWTVTIERLPSKLAELIGATLDNNIYMIGEILKGT